MQASATQSGFNSKVLLIFLLVIADLVINGVADFDPLPRSDWFLPIIWVGCVLCFFKPPSPV